MKLSLLIFFALTFLLSCKDDKIDPNLNPDFNMKINGELWEPDMPSMFFTNKKPNIEFNKEKDYLFISAQNLKLDEHFYFLVENIFSSEDHEISDKLFFGLYDLELNNECKNTCRFEKSDDCEASYNTLVSSTFNLIKLDTLNNRISASFSITLKNNLDETIFITEGNIDSIYDSE